MVSKFYNRSVNMVLNYISYLSLANKLLVYKAVPKPVWFNGVQLWGSESNSNLEILERFQSKVSRIITDAPRYVPNAVIKRDLQSVIGWTRSAKLQCHLPTQRLDGHYKQPGKIFISMNKLQS